MMKAGVVRPIIRMHRALQLPVESVHDSKPASQSLREFAAAEAKAAVAAAKQKAEEESLQLELQLLGVSPSEIKHASNSGKEVYAHNILPIHNVMLHCVSANLLVLRNV
jgi:hypothetical protein